jgi:uncharacterized membrane protein
VKRFLRHIRDAFVSGLLAVIPVGVTFYILWFLYQRIDGLVGRTTPFGLMVQKALGHWIPGLGIYVTLIVILLIGVATRSFLGRVLQYYMERVFFSLPGVRKMYATLKQFTNALLNRESSSAFQKVVMFEYPKEGIHILGLVTNEELGKLQQGTGEESLLVYAPTAPNPLSGMMLIIPKSKVTYIDMPVEDALSMVVSSGSVLPDSLRKVKTKSAKPRFNLFRRR